MKLLELLEELKNKPFVKELTKLEDALLSSQNLKLYAQHYIETNGILAKETKAFIYVLDEGLDTEEAFYKEKEPASSLNVSNTLITKYQSEIDNVRGKVIEQNEKFLVIEGYEEVNDEMVKKTWFLEEVDGDVSFKVVK